MTYFSYVFFAFKPRPLRSLLSTAIEFIASAIHFGDKSFSKIPLTPSSTSSGRLPA
jgi:hypothetical protein